MKNPRNILFIMADQLRWDYLGCAGHPALRTPNLDALAARGIRFTNAYAQSGICGPSRMSFYTGRYVSTHGCSWNQVPLNAGIWTMGDYLRRLGIETTLCGKTHMAADLAGLKRLGVETGRFEGILAQQGGFIPYLRDDGLHPDQLVSPDLAYNRYLHRQGYSGKNPWQDWANSAEGTGGKLLSGWYWRNAAYPARIREEDSETPWMTRQAIDYIEKRGAQPWCLHLSYIKPHWPYMAPEPYFSQYGPEDILPVRRDPIERETAHRVMKAFMQHSEGQTFLRKDARKTIIPAYMALIAQLDTEIGRLIGAMEKLGRLDDTLIIFTSDHGDYLGDHWLGEKELFHDAVVKIPLIMVHPAASVRGDVTALVEAIDLIPTFIDALGGDIPGHMLQGRSLLPFTQSRQTPDNWRQYVVCELDYNHRKARLLLGRNVNECKAWMLRDHRYKYVYYQGFRPQLFDLENDPQEFHDLGKDPTHRHICKQFQASLFDWFCTRRTLRDTLPDDAVEYRTDSWGEKGVIFGEW